MRVGLRMINRALCAEFSASPAPSTKLCRKECSRPVSIHIPADARQPITPDLSSFRHARSICGLVPLTMTLPMLVDYSCGGQRRMNEVAGAIRLTGIVRHLAVSVLGRSGAAVAN